MASTAYRELDPRHGLAFLSTACALVRAGAAACRACRDACPADAVELGDSGVTVTNNCLGCGRCVGACPTGALSLGSLTGEGQLPAGDAVLAVECAKVPVAQHAGATQVVPCLGSLSPAHLLELVLDNPQRTLQLIEHGWCRDCAAGRGLDAVLTERLARVRELLRAAGWPTARLPARRKRPLRRAKAPGASASTTDAPRLDRRRFFGQLAGQAAQALTAAPLPSPSPVRALLRRTNDLFPERLRWVRALQRLTQTTARPMPAGAFAAVRVVGDCRDHGVCAAVCPTGALQRNETDTHVWLDFTAAWCTGCGLCARHCPTQALAVTASARGADPLAPATVTLHPRRLCPECGATVTADGLCAPCEKSRALAHELFASRAAGDHASSP
jgi:Fe-S-cluster-containing hydrogenase component 2